MGRAVGIDVGGTKIAAGLIEADGSIVARARRETPEASADAVVDAIGALVEEFGEGARGLPVGIGVAGFVDADRTCVLFAPNLGWHEVLLADAVSQQLDRPVVVENDANAAAWAEARFGAGAGADPVVCVTVGTGIGGGVIAGGALARGRFGVAAEFGHLALVEGGIRCGCGQYGCWEQYASGSALTRRGRDLVVSGAPSGEALRAACGGDPSVLDGSMVTAAAADGDPGACALVAELGHWMGVGLAAVAALLDPARFVIGGGVAETGDLLLEPVRDSFARRLPAGPHRPHAEIVVAALGNEAGLVGAADLARGS